MHLGLRVQYKLMCWQVVPDAIPVTLTLRFIPGIVKTAQRVAFCPQCRTMVPLLFVLPVETVPEHRGSMELLACEDPGA